MFVVRLQNTTGVMTMKLYRVHGFGCGNRAHDDDGFATKQRCSEWCGDQDKCVVALRSIEGDNNLPVLVMDAAPACEPERSVSESIAAGHPCFDPDGPPDHDWEYVDDSFSHEFGTEICGHYECARCNAIKPE